MEYRVLWCERDDDDLNEDEFDDEDKVDVQAIYNLHIDNLTKCGYLLSQI